MKRSMSFSILILVVILSALVAAPVYAGNHDAGRGEKTPVFIGFSQQPGPAEQALVRGAGGDIKYTYTVVRAIAASLPQAGIDGLRNNPKVSYIEPVIEVHIVDHPTRDAELDYAWGVAHIGSGAVHIGGNRGMGVKVAVLDTGIDTDHPDLNYDPTCSDSTSYGTVEDGNDHGTHTAGTVAALDDDIGVVGVAPEVTLCIFKVLSDSGGGSYADVVAALDFIFAYNNKNSSNKILVTSNSYGSSGDPGTTVHQAFDKTYNTGVLHAAAAGNSGNPKGKGNNCIYPARWDSLIATAATKQDDTRANFSSTCDAMELAAPVPGKVNRARRRLRRFQRHFHGDAPRGWDGGADYRQRNQ